MFIQRLPQQHISLINLLNKIRFIEIFTCLFHKWLQLWRLFASSINNNALRHLVMDFPSPFLISSKHTHTHTRNSSTHHTHPRCRRRSSSSSGSTLTHNHRLNGKWLQFIFVLFLSFRCFYCSFHSIQCCCVGVHSIGRVPISSHPRHTFPLAAVLCWVVVVSMATVLRSTALINELRVSWIDSHVIFASSIYSSCSLARNKSLCGKKAAYTKSAHHHCCRSRQNRPRITLHDDTGSRLETRRYWLWEFFLLHF